MEIQFVHLRRQVKNLFAPSVPSPPFLTPFNPLADRLFFPSTSVYFINNTMCDRGTENRLHLFRKQSCCCSPESFYPDHSLAPTESTLIVEEDVLINHSSEEGDKRS